MAGSGRNSYLVLMSSFHGTKTEIGETITQVKEDNTVHMSPESLFLLFLFLLLSLALFFFFFFVGGEVNKSKLNEGIFF